MGHDRRARQEDRPDRGEKGVSGGGGGVIGGRRRRVGGGGEGGVANDRGALE